jgi:hypothetical protein
MTVRVMSWPRGEVRRTSADLPIPDEIVAQQSRQFRPKVNIVERLRPAVFRSKIEWIADDHRSAGGDEALRKIGDMTKAYAVPAPSDSVLAPLYVGADLLDAFAIRLPGGQAMILKC